MTYWEIDKKVYLLKPCGVLGYLISSIKESGYDPDLLKYVISLIRFAPLTNQSDLPVDLKIDLLLATLSRQKRHSVSLEVFITLVSTSLAALALLNDVGAVFANAVAVVLMLSWLCMLLFVLHKLCVEGQLDRLDIVLRILRSSEPL